MRISTEIWHTRRAFGDFKTIDVVADAGFDGIDFSFNTMCDWDEVMERPDSVDIAKRLKQHANERGIAFCQAHAPLDFRHGMPLSFESREFRSIVKSMEFAAQLGVPIIVVHGIEPPAYIDVHEYNLEFFNALLPFCKLYDIKIGVENLFEFYADGYIGAKRFGTPESFCKMLDLLDPEYFVGCVDVGHAKLTGYQPEDFLYAAKDRVKCLHIHCNDGNLDSHQLPYFAPCNWDGLMKALRDINYDGWFTFELIGYLGRFPAELLPDALKLAAATGRYLIER